MPLNLEKLRKLIEAAGGVTAVAKAAHMQQPNLSRILSGRSNPTKMIDRLATALKTKSRELID